MGYQVTRAEGNALHFLALALRPEWATSSPAEAWQTKISNNTFPYAENFEHCIAALIDYCKASKQGKPVFKFPTLYPTDEDTWKRTVPTSVEKNPRDPCPDHPLDNNNWWNCIGCRSEIITGQRPRSMQGKHYVIASEVTPGV